MDSKTVSHLLLVLIISLAPLGCSDISSDLDCQAFTNPNECDEAPECFSYSAARIPVDDLIESGESCRDRFDGSGPRDELEHFCIGDMSFSQAFHAYARFDEDNQEWSVYWTPDIPDSPHQMGFRECSEIPEEDYSELREICFECRGW